jgi:sensor domain CHASE-containing protein
MVNATEKSGKRFPGKPLFIAGVGVVALFVFLLISSRVFFLNSYAMLEEREVEQNVQRALSGLDNELTQLSTVTGDYAGWDESYRFVKDGNGDFIRINLSDEIYPKLKLNIILFVDTSGKIVYERMIDVRNPGRRATPDSMHPYLSPAGPLVRHVSTESILSGLLMLPEGPLLVVSRPILTSEYRGPVRGALIMGRFLDKQEVARLAELTHLSLDFFPVNGTGMPSDVKAALSAARGNQEVSIQRLSPERATGYALVSDIYSKPSLVLRVEMPRYSYRQGVATIRYYIITVMALGLVAAVFGCIMYQKLRTAHDELEQRVTERTAELREKDRILLLQSRQAAMGEMIGNIAHQWRQPLNSLGCIIQSLPLLHEAGELNRGALESAEEKVMGIIFHMSQTIDDFRNYFKPDREQSLFNVFRAVSRTVSFIEDSFRSLGIAIKVNAEESPVVNGYLNAYSQVLLNILINARDAFSERKTAQPMITIAIRAENGRSVVTISDNAGGIPEDVIDKVFEPYFTTKGPDKGTGVGLFMSKGIIERNMGGRLSVRNTEQGAEFTIEV